jgi:hypothetical protein
LISLHFFWSLFISWSALFISSWFPSSSLCISLHLFLISLHLLICIIHLLLISFHLSWSLLIFLLNLSLHLSWSPFFISLGLSFSSYLQLRFRVHCQKNPESWQVLGGAPYAWCVCLITNVFDVHKRPSQMIPDIQWKLLSGKEIH